jgi:hypothetical protein
MKSHCFTPPQMAALTAAAISSGDDNVGCCARCNPSMSNRWIAFTMAASIKG